MPAQIESENSPSVLSVIDRVREATKWHYVCNVIEILTGGREEKYSYEAAIALFIIKSWLSSSKSLLFAVKKAPAIFCCLVLSERIKEIVNQKDFLYRSFVDVFNNAIDKHDLKPTLNAAFGTKDIIDFLINNTWRPHRSGVTDKMNKFDIERLNKLTEYRLRLGNEGCKFGVNDAASLLGAMRSETAWKSTSVKDVRSRWKEKEAFLFIGKTEEFSSIVSFGDSNVADLLRSIEADAINYQRNTNYFSNVKRIISRLTPESSKDLEEYEPWRKIENPGPILLAPLNKDERKKMCVLGIQPTVRRSAEEIKAAKRPRSK